MKKYNKYHRTKLIKNLINTITRRWFSHTQMYIQIHYLLTFGK